jgi:hypothetical protein
MLETRAEHPLAAHYYDVQKVISESAERWQVQPVPDSMWPVIASYVGWLDQELILAAYLMTEKGWLAMCDRAAVIRLSETAPSETRAALSIETDPECWSQATLHPDRDFQPVMHASNVHLMRGCFLDWWGVNLPLWVAALKQPVARQPDSRAKPDKHQKREGPGQPTLTEASAWKSKRKKAEECQRLIELGEFPDLNSELSKDDQIHSKFGVIWKTMDRWIRAMNGENSGKSLPNNSP